MKKPYLDQWQRRMIIENYGFSGSAFKVNIEMKKIARDIDSALIKILYSIINLIEKASN